MKHPRVAMCAVVGTPDERYGELVTAVCVLKKGEEATLTLDDLRTFCKELIAGYKWVSPWFLSSVPPHSRPIFVLLFSRDDLHQRAPTVTTNTATITTQVPATRRGLGKAPCQRRRQDPQA